MISSLLFFLVGLTIFIVKSQIKADRIILRLLLFLVSGAVSGAIVGLITGSPLKPLMDIPWPGIALVGAMAGALLLQRKSGISLFGRASNTSSLSYWDCLLPD